MEQVRDPKALRALAHRLRLRLLEELMLAGSATATELAERVGESPANCSWHLRQLAKYGYVEEAGGGPGRRRPWRPVVRVRQLGDRAAGDPEMDRAADEAGDVLLEHELAALRQWQANRQTEPVSWQRAAFYLQSAAWLTADELAAIEEQLTALAASLLDRVRDPSLRPPGARPVRLTAWGIPAGPPLAHLAATSDPPATPDKPRATQKQRAPKTPRTRRQPAKEQHHA